MEDEIAIIEHPEADDCALVPRYFAEPYKARLRQSGITLTDERLARARSGVDVVEVEFSRGQLDLVVDETADFLGSQGIMAEFDRDRVGPTVVHYRFRRPQGLPLMG